MPQKKINSEIQLETEIRKNHYSPLSNWRRPEASTQKTVLPATQNLFETSMQTQAQNKNMLACPCKQRAVMHVHAQGLFLPARTAAKMAFASSLLYAPVLVQLTSCIPACCSHSHQPISPIDLLHPCVLFAFTPTKFLCQVITETS